MATPHGGTFRDSVRVSLAVPGHPDAQIRYTLDGSDPTLTSPMYTTSLLFVSNSTLNAKIRMARPITEMVKGTEVTYPNAILKDPIAAVSIDRGSAACLNCVLRPADFFLQAGNHPEWVEGSIWPFIYKFRIYDQLCQFVARSEGSISKEQLDKAPPDSAGYRAIRFRWLPVATFGYLRKY